MAPAVVGSARMTSHPWAGRPVVWLLEAVLVGEAEGEGAWGMRAVGWVVRNRALRPGAWGREWREVLLAPWQFSCLWGRDFDARRGAMEREPRGDVVVAVAREVYAGEGTDPTAGATYYVNLAVARPRWLRGMVETAHIGHHTFFRDPRAEGRGRGVHD